MLAKASIHIHALFVGVGQKWQICIMVIVFALLFFSFVNYMPGNINLFLFIGFGRAPFHVNNFALKAHSILQTRKP